MKRRPNRLAGDSALVDLAALGDAVERFREKKIVLLGDFIADEFQFGEISRVSREAPVLILRHRETELLPGGGANAANNLADLGARVLPVTAVGDDAAGEALVDYFRKKRVDTSGVLGVRGSKTPVKTRFLAGWPHTRRHQVLRVDYEPKNSFPDAARKQISKRLLERLDGAAALMVSDYGFGVATPELVRRAKDGKRKTLPLITLDSRYALTSYAGCGVTAATPNEPELEALHHLRIAQDLKTLARCGRATLESMKLRSLLVTRGKDGMALFERARPMVAIPIYGSDQALDVTGAGDTVIAAYTLALASGASALEAAHLANFAGAIVVMKRGTATASAGELLETVHAEATGGSKSRP